jgi:TolB protein
VTSAKGVGYNADMRLASPSRRPLFFTLLAVGLCVGLGLAAFLALPQLTSFSPAAGASEISSLAPIRLNFNRPMNTATLEGALRFEPQRVGAFTWEENTLIFTPREPWPVGGVVTVTLAGGQALSGLPLLGSQTWSFGVSDRRIAYLLADPVPNVWVLPLTEGVKPRLLTDELMGVVNFDVSPDGTQIVYAARRADGSADLRMINVDGTGLTDFLLCPGEACVSPVFSRDGKRIAYERHGLSADNSIGDSHVHLYTPATGQDELIGDPASQTLFPRWGPDGRLSYFDVTRQAIVVQDLATGAVTYIPNSSGELGTWSPDGQFVVYPELVLPSIDLSVLPGGENSDKLYSQLFKVQIATNQTQRLSEAGLVDEGSPAFSPSGEWLALGRRSLEPKTWTPGRQIWLMKADGSEARPLTDEPLYNHSALVWGRDGTALIYMRFNTTDPGEPTAIWMMDIVETEQGVNGVGARRLATGGYLPEWLP